METSQTEPAALIEALRAELAAEAARADMGEMARPLTHDFNNFLNNLLLTLAIMEQVGGDVTGSLAKLRRQADRVAALIKEFHESRGRKPAATGPVNVNHGVRDAAALLAREYPDLLTQPSGGIDTLPMTFDYAPDLPPVTGSRLDLVRLAMFLLKNVATAARHARTPARIRTAQTGGNVLVRAELSGIQVGSDVTGRFESLGGVVRGMGNLELATCSSIARRFRGKLTAEAAPGGLTIALEMPAAS
jgi:signal transduction histidine kinase